MAAHQLRRSIKTLSFLSTSVFIISTAASVSAYGSTERIFLDQSVLDASVTGPLRPGTTTIDLPADAVIREDGSACIQMPVALNVNPAVVGRAVAALNSLYHIDVELKPGPLVSSIIRLSEGSTVSTLEICGRAGETVAATLSGRYWVGIGPSTSLPSVDFQASQNFTFADFNCAPNVAQALGRSQAWTLTDQQIQYAPRLNWSPVAVAGPVPQPNFPDAYPLGYSCAPQGEVQIATPGAAGARNGAVLVSKEAAACEKSHKSCSIRLGNQSWNLKSAAVRKSLNCAAAVPLPPSSAGALALTKRGPVDPVVQPPQTLRSYLCLPIPNNVGKYDLLIEKRGKIIDRGTGESYIQCQYYAVSNTYYCGVYQDGDFTISLDSTIRRTVKVTSTAVIIERGKRAK